MSSKNSRSISSNWLTRVSDEIEALNEIYLDTFKLITPNQTIQIKIIPNSLKVFQNTNPKCMVKLVIDYNPNYPKVLPTLTISKTYNFTKKETDEMYTKMYETAQECSENNMEMIHEICTVIQEIVNKKAQQNEPLNLSINSSDNLSDTEEVNLPKKGNKKHIEQNAFENVRNAMLECSNNNSEEQNNSESNSIELNISVDDNNNTNILGNIDNNENMPFSQKPSSNYNQTYSRFKSDFTVISKLGQGGGGSVFKVQNHWDKMFYAIKRIKLFLPKKGDLNTILNTVRSEGYVLSRMQNPYIVRYYQTWVEDFQEEDYVDEKDNESEYELLDEEEDKKNIEDTNRKLSYEKKTISKIEDKANVQTRNSNSFTTDNNVCFNNIWDMDDNDEGEHEEDEIIFEEDPNEQKSRSKSVTKKTVRENTETRREEKKARLKTLYIQMEYCEGKTLREAIDNKILTTEQKWKLITQILEAVRFIHSKKLIHRDIKPGNIFLDANFNVKLGDFGLAKITKTKSQLDDLVITSTKKEIMNINDNDLMTFAIGTKYYCSPEQEKSKNYNYKSDMFSLGIIIFEMFYSFNSLMERDIVLRGIKEEMKYPDNFDKDCDSNVVQIVKMLTNHNPNLRPKTEDLLNSNLIPIILNEQTVVDNFIKIIDENENYSQKFLEILINKSLNSKIQNNSNHKSNRDSYYTSYDSLQTNLLLNNALSYNSNGNVIFYINEQIQNKIKKIMHESNAYYTRFSECELYNHNEYILFDEETKKVSKIIINSNNDSIIDNLMLTKTNNVIIRTKTIFSQLTKLLNNLSHNSQNQSKIASMLPIKFYTDSIYTAFPFYYKKLNVTTEYLDMTLVSLWNDIAQCDKGIIDYDNAYIVDCLITVFTILEKCNLNVANTICIRINSSTIFDIIFTKLFGRGENVNELKIEVLSQISKILNGRESIVSLKDFKKFYYKNNTNYNIPVTKDKLEDLLSWMNINGEIETIKKRFEKKELYKEIEKIANIFNDEKLWKGKYYPYQYMNQIKIDFSYIPNDLVFYSGIFMQFCIIDNRIKIPIIECGRIDNYLSNENDVYHGFGVRLIMDNIFKIEQKKTKEKEENLTYQYKHDILVISLTEDFFDKKIKYLYEIFKKENINYDIIFRVQSNTKFEDYFKLYRMKCLMIVTNNKEEFYFEAKTRDVSKKYIDTIDIKEIIQIMNLSTKKKRC